MAFNGTEGQQITIADASILTANHRTAHPNARQGTFMGKDILNSILAQPGCMGIRTYHGLDSAGNRELILVGVDMNENDIIEGIVADRGPICPPYCSTSNPLNS